MHIPKKIYFLVGLACGAVFLGDAGGDLIVGTVATAGELVGSAMNLTADSLGNVGDAFD